MSQQPAWLKRLSIRVCECIDLMENLPFGCHCYQDGELWEVSLFISSTEFVGGPNDGERAPTNYVVNIHDLVSVFDDIETASWQAHRMNDQDDLGSHFAVIGKYEGRQIWLRILANAPDHIPAGRYANVHEQRFIDAW